MKGRNLLVIFGGTNQREPQTIFTPDELRRNETDILQFNLLTEKPSIVYEVMKQTGKNCYVDKTHLLYKADRGIDIIENEQLVNPLSPLFNALNKMANYLAKSVKWSESRLNYSIGSSLRGISKEILLKLSKQSLSVVKCILNEPIGKDYDNVIVLAHSRGCGIATEVANEFKDDVDIGEKFLRLVLLDPVSKNANKSADAHIKKEHQEYIQEMRLKGEVHIIVKTRHTERFYGLLHTDYKTYADRLVGTEKGRKCKDATKSMLNIYVHVAAMAHEDMLTKELCKAFPRYRAVILGEKYRLKDNNICTPLEDLKVVDYVTAPNRSSTLLRYMNSEKSASNIKNGKKKPGEEDLFGAVYELFDKQLKDRRRAFTHCFAKKVVNVLDVDEE